MISIVVNGQPREVAEGTTVQALLENLGANRGAVAVELNLEVLPRAEHPRRQLAAGDRLEIVTLVGGG